MNVEKRALSLTNCRLNDLDDNARKFSGYGSVYGVVDSYGTTFARGCFEESLTAHRAAGTMPFMFLNHDLYSLPIGKWSAMEEDDYGLRVEGELLDTVDGLDTYKVLKAGAVNGLSIGFIPQEYNTHDDAEHRATFTKVDLVETSVVTFPSNKSARVDEVRNLIQDGMSIRQLEEFLRQQGVSRAAAIAVVSQFESKSEIKRLEDERQLIAAMDKFIRAAK
jgi:HK97 family phage prohead protease